MLWNVALMDFKTNLSICSFIAGSMSSSPSSELPSPAKIPSKSSNSVLIQPLGPMSETSEWPSLLSYSNGYQQPMFSWNGTSHEPYNSWCLERKQKKRVKWQRATLWLWTPLVKEFFDWSFFLRCFFLLLDVLGALESGSQNFHNSIEASKIINK